MLRQCYGTRHTQQIFAFAEMQLLCEMWQRALCINASLLDLGDESLPSCDSLYENSLFLLKGEDLKWLTTAKETLQSDRA
jgi:hypothetical protein